MRHLFSPLLLLLAACGAAEQREWIELTAAYGIVASSQRERDQLLRVFERVAETEGHHMDAATGQELASQADVYEQSIKACIWVGEDDEEMLACAQDFEERLGLVFVTFYRGTDPQRNQAFRRRLLHELQTEFGQLPTIPQMPNGALPLAEDLILEDGNYAVSEENSQKYEARSEGTNASP